MSVTGSSRRSGWPKTVWASPCWVINASRSVRIAVAEHLGREHRHRRGDIAEIDAQPCARERLGRGVAGIFVRRDGEGREHNRLLGRSRAERSGHGLRLHQAARGQRERGGGAHAKDVTKGFHGVRLRGLSKRDRGTHEYRRSARARAIGRSDNQLIFHGPR